MNNWKKLTSKVVHTNPFFTVKEEEVIRPDKSRGIFYIIEQNNSVMIVPLTKSCEIYLIHLYRYPTKMYSWEVPGGAMETNDVIGSAKKELREETGLISHDWQILGNYQAMNGCINKTGFILLAKNVVETDENKQAEEGIIRMKKVTFKTAVEMIRKGEVTDSHTVTALTLTGLSLGLLKSGNY